MVRRIGGFRKKTRRKFKKEVRMRGKISINRFLQTFDINDIVCLNAESAYYKGMYYPRFHGRTGKIVGKQGSCYKIKINDMGKDKVLVVHPLHLKKI